MRCEQCRESVSARLDGEDDPARRPATDAHLARCAQCRRWLDSAAMVTRLARIGLAAGGSSVPRNVVGKAPRRGRADLVGALRVMLGAVGGGQLLLAVAQIAVPAMTRSTIAGTMQGASADHLVHESAAWNAAIGAGFLFIAWRRTRPVGVLPILSVFVGVLLAVSVGDILAGAVQTSHLAGHALLIIGYGCVATLYRIAPGTPDPWSGRRGGSRWRLTPGDTNVVELPQPPHASEPAASFRDRTAA